MDAIYSVQRIKNSTAMVCQMPGKCMSCLQIEDKPFAEPAGVKKLLKFISPESLAVSFF